MARMTRWTDAKLDKEIAFAEAADEPGAEADEWLAHLRAERDRRDAHEVNIAAENKFY